MTVLTVHDLLLWMRCRRQWSRQCRPKPGLRSAPVPQDMIGIANLRETARVVTFGTGLFGGSHRDLTPEIAREERIPAVAYVLETVSSPELLSSWGAATDRALADHEPFINGLLRAEDLTFVIDLGWYHSRTGGWELALFRPGTGLRGAFEDEAAICALTCRNRYLPVSAIHLYYLDKTWRSSGVINFMDAEGREDWKDAFRESNVTGKAERRRRRIEQEIQDLRAYLHGESVISEDYRCRQNCRYCSRIADTADTADTDDEARADGTTGTGRDYYDVLTLHKGRHIGRELLSRGIRDIRDIEPGMCKLTDRQKIQIEVVRSGTPHVDGEKVRAFLENLEWPLLFLDFEAYSQSVPPVAGVTPYEHVPVIASIHRQDTPRGKPVEKTYAMSPGRDERAAFFNWLLEHLEDRGTIVVFSRPFETAMVRQLATAGGNETAGQALIARMVDLLHPFAAFMVYHPEQRGKVSLKRILPIYTSSDYGEVNVRDGMHANLSCTRLADQVVAGETEGLLAKAATAAEGASTYLGRRVPEHLNGAARREDVVRYCAMDTLAMVELVDTLWSIAGCDDG